MPRFRARRPAAEIPPPPHLDAQLDVAVRVAEVRYRADATELVLRDRLEPQWADDVRGWLAPLYRVAERT